jgi:hypothetical protein
VRGRSRRRIGGWRRTLICLVNWKLLFLHGGDTGRSCKSTWSRCSCLTLLARQSNRTVWPNLARGTIYARRSGRARWTIASILATGSCQSNRSRWPWRSFVTKPSAGSDRSGRSLGSWHPLWSRRTVSSVLSGRPLGARMPVLSVFSRLAWRTRGASESRGSGSTWPSCRPWMAITAG